MVAVENARLTGWRSGMGGACTGILLATVGALNGTVAVVEKENVGRCELRTGAGADVSGGGAMANGTHAVC